MLRKLKQSFFGATLALTLGTCTLIPATAGCAEILPYFRKAAVVSDQAAPWIELIANFLTNVLGRAGASAEARAEVEKNIDRARKTHAALRNLAQLGEAASEGDVARATKEFEEAITALYAAGKAFGLEIEPGATLPPQDGRVAASQADRLGVPPVSRLVLEAQ